MDIVPVDTLYNMHVHYATYWQPRCKFKEVYLIKSASCMIQFRVAKEIDLQSYFKIAAPSNLTTLNFKTADNHVTKKHQKLSNQHIPLEPYICIIVLELHRLYFLENRIILHALVLCPLLSCTYHYAFLFYLIKFLYRTEKHVSNESERYGPYS